MRTRSRALLFLVVVIPAVAQAAQSSDITLALRTLIARREPILDAVEAADRLIVLGRDTIAIYAAAEAVRGAPAQTTATLTHTRPWPRDLRGRLRIDGDRLEAFLPGVVCRGRLRPLAVSCADETAAWPVGLDNSGVAPSRNSLATPEGLVFYGAADLAPSGAARWLIADAGGEVAFLDQSRSVTSRGEAADDVARLRNVCGDGTLVVSVARSPSSPQRDDVRLQRVSEQSLTLVASLTMPGAVTALWADPQSPAATVVVHEPGTARYEAHQISPACVR
jgi:hypothetical protein